MKTRQYLFGTMLFCASAAFISCSSSDDDNAITPVQPDEGLTTITVGAPIIEQEGSSANTRMTFGDDGGLTMAWEAGDYIRIRAWKTISETLYQSKADYATTAKSSGPTTTFAAPSSTSDLYTFNGQTQQTPDYYYIALYKCTSGDAKSALDGWAGRSIAEPQTQAGNNDRAHLKDQYGAILMNVNSINPITFSQSWATLNGGGTFEQNSCIKFNLALPFGKKAGLNTITKMEVTGTNSSGKSSALFFKQNSTSSSATDLTLNFTGITSLSENLVGYYMLGAQGMRYYNGGKMIIKVYYGDGTDYIYKEMTFASNYNYDPETRTDPNIRKGKLYTVKLNSSNWHNSNGTLIE